MGEEIASAFAEAKNVFFSRVFARIATTMGLVVLSTAALSGCQPYGCQAGFSTPAYTERDLAEFNRVLGGDRAFRGLKATAVHDHEVDVVDTNVRRDAPQGTFKYNQVGGISDKLRDARGTTFARLHPNALNVKIVDIEVRDTGGRWIMGISSGKCATLQVAPLVFLSGGFVTRTTVSR